MKSEMKNNTNKNKGAGLTKDINVSEKKDTQNNQATNRIDGAAKL